MTDDRAMKCAEEIVTTQNPQPYIHTLHIAGNQATTEAWMWANEKRTLDELLEKYRADVAAIIRKHYPSSWTRIEKDKPETYPPIQGMHVMVYTGDGYGRIHESYWDAVNNRWSSSPTSWVEGVTHWQFLPAAPEEK